MEQFVLRNQGGIGRIGWCIKKAAGFAEAVVAEQGFAKRIVCLHAPGVIAPRDEFRVGEFVVITEGRTVVDFEKRWRCDGVQHVVGVLRRIEHFGDCEGIARIGRGASGSRPPVESYKLLCVFFHMAFAGWLSDFGCFRLYDGKRETTSSDKCVAVPIENIDADGIVAFFQAVVLGGFGGCHSSKIDV